MKLYLLRHGRADWPEWDQPDDERPLTKKGKKEMRRVAKFLCRLKIAPALILTSPLPRARETAEIVARRLCRELKEDDALAPGFRPHKLRILLERYGRQDLMIVGHESDFSRTIAGFTGGRIELAKGGLARVDLDQAGRRGELIWLLTPKMAKASRH